MKTNPSQYDFNCDNCGKPVKKGEPMSKEKEQSFGPGCTEWYRFCETCSD